MDKELDNRGSLYPADGRIYGDFSCRILGYPARLRAENGSVKDALGVPVMPGDLCLHVSGKDVFGKRVRLQFVSATGLLREQWSDRDETRDVLIATTEPRQSPESVAEWSSSWCFFTLSGLRTRFSHRGSFDAVDVWEEYDTWQRTRSGYTPRHLLRDRQLRSIRTFCNSCVGVDTSPLLPLLRSGRWKWRFTS